MFVWLRVQGFESWVNKVFQKEKLVNSKTKIYIPNLEAELSSDNWQKSPIWLRWSQNKTLGRHNIQHNNKKIVTLGIMALLLCWCPLCWMSQINSLWWVSLCWMSFGLNDIRPNYSTNQLRLWTTSTTHLLLCYTHATTLLQPAVQIGCGFYTNWWIF